MAILSRATDRSDLSGCKAHAWYFHGPQIECKEEKGSRNHTASHSALGWHSCGNITLVDILAKTSPANSSAQSAGLAVGLCRHLSPTNFCLGGTWYCRPGAASPLPERGVGGDRQLGKITPGTVTMKDYNSPSTG